MTFRPLEAYHEMKSPPLPPPSEEGVDKEAFQGG